MSYFSSRDAETTLSCPKCSEHLHIARTCHKVYMHCPQCHKEFPLEEYITKSDAKMENFLENVYFDRI